MVTTFGLRLKELRVEQGIRQEDLAEQMGEQKERCPNGKGTSGSQILTR